MNLKNYGFRARLKYSFDNFMSKGGLSVFSALIVLFLSAFILMAVMRFIMNKVMPQDNLTRILDQFWQVFIQLCDQQQHPHCHSD